MSKVKAEFSAWSSWGGFDTHTLLLGGGRISPDVTDHRVAGPCSGKIYKSDNGSWKPVTWFELFNNKTGKHWLVWGEEAEPSWLLPWRVECRPCYVMPQLLRGHRGGPGVHQFPNGPQPGTVLEADESFLIGVAGIHVTAQTPRVPYPTPWKQTYTLRVYLHISTSRRPRTHGSWDSGCRSPQFSD